MKEINIQSMIACLPAKDREEAKYRITRAALDGVTHIGFWGHIDVATGEIAIDINDLVGNCPKYREELRAQGDDHSSGLISLNKYASQ